MTLRTERVRTLDQVRAAHLPSGAGHLREPFPERSHPVEGGPCGPVRSQTLPSYRTGGGSEGSASTTATSPGQRVPLYGRGRKRRP